MCWRCLSTRDDYRRSTAQREDASRKNRVQFDQGSQIRTVPAFVYLVGEIGQTAGDLGGSKGVGSCAHMQLGRVH